MSVPPRSLGITTPEGESVYEIFVEVNSRPSILGKISDIMGKRNIDIIGAHVQVSDDKAIGYIILYVEMAKSTASIDEVIQTLKKQEYVRQVNVLPRNEVFFEGIMYPLTSGGHYRVFVLWTSVWGAIIKSLNDMFGKTAGLILRNEGTSAGRAVMRRIEERFTLKGAKIPDKKVQLENFKEFCKASGFGIIKLEGEPPRIKVTISSSLATEHTGLVDDFLIGMVKGALEHIYDLNFVVENLEMSDNQFSFDVATV